jgi:hypothetical protein
MTAETAREKIDLNAYKDAIRKFAAEWEEKPLAARGVRETIKTATLELMLEVKTLISKGYTVNEVVAGLESMNLKVSLATLKTYFSQAKAELKREADEAAGIKPKAKKSKAATPETPNAAKSETPHTPAPATVIQPKKTAGAQAADKDDY